MPHRKVQERGFLEYREIMFFLFKGQRPMARKENLAGIRNPEEAFRIELNSYCRNCNRKGHWKAECPCKSTGTSVTGSSSTPSTASGSLPTTTATVEGQGDVMPLEFLHLPIIGQASIDDTLPVLVSFCNLKRGTQPRSHRLIQGECNGDNWDNGGSPFTAKERLQSWGLWSESRDLNSLPTLPTR